MQNSEKSYLIALGANLSSRTGMPAETLHAAVAALAGCSLILRSVSRFYRTPCFPTDSGPDYINAAVSVRSALSPQELLQQLHRVEAEFGRERRQRWGARVLDLDLLACEDQVLPDREAYAKWAELPPDEQIKATPDTLILPHPRLQDRAFVLCPLLDIAPGWRHPVLGQSVRALCAALPETDRAEVRAL